MERVLSMDMATKIGWALTTTDGKEISLEAYGLIPATEMPDTPYPGSYVEWANIIFGKILNLIDEQYPDVLVIEETTKGSKNSFSQKILEFIHYLVAKFIKDTGIKAVYMMTGQWRSETGCSMTKEEKIRNKAVREYKKKNDTTIAYDEKGKRIGIIGKKHVGVRRANEVFGSQLKKPLIRKDEDVADALMMNYAYHLRKKV